MSDIYDALLGNDQNTPVANAELVARLRKQEELGRIAALTGDPALQKMGPQLQDDAQAQATGLYKTRQAEKDRKEARDAAAAIASEREKDRMAIADQNSKDRGLQRDNMAAMLADRLESGRQTIQDKADTKAAAALDKQQGAAQNLNDALDNGIDAVHRLYEHPGLNNITGFVNSRTIDVRDKSRDAQSLLGSIKSQVMINTMRALKAASPTGSTGFGQLSNAEGDALRNSIASLDTNQSYEAMRGNLATIEKYLNLAKERNKQATDRAAAAVSGPSQTVTTTQGFRKGSALPLTRGAAAPSAAAETYEQKKARLGL